MEVQEDQSDGKVGKKLDMVVFWLSGALMFSWSLLYLVFFVMMVQKWWAVLGDRWWLSPSFVMGWGGGGGRE